MNRFVEIQAWQEYVDAKTVTLTINIDSIDYICHEELYMVISGVCWIFEEETASMLIDGIKTGHYASDIR